MLAAEAICHREVACGEVEISCSGGTSVATQCSATIVYPEVAGCVSDVERSMVRLLSCPTIAPQQVNMIELCVDALAAQACVTQAQADAVAQAAEMNVPLPASPQPPECEFLATPLPGCG